MSDEQIYGFMPFNHADRPVEAMVGETVYDYNGKVLGWIVSEQAIAAWNTRAERTCRIESSYLNDFTSKHECWYEFEMQCGYRFTWDEMEPPRFCPNCGGEVREKAGNE